MNRSYILILSPLFATRKSAQKFLTEHPNVETWYACLPNTIMFVSDLSASQLATELELEFGTGPGTRFIIIESSRNKQGRLPRQAWHLLNNPDNPRLKK